MYFSLTRLQAWYDHIRQPNTRALICTLDVRLVVPKRDCSAKWVDLKHATGALLHVMCHWRLAHYSITDAGLRLSVRSLRGWVMKWNEMQLRQEMELVVWSAVYGRSIEPRSVVAKQLRSRGGETRKRQDARNEKEMRRSQDRAEMNWNEQWSRVKWESNKMWEQDAITWNNASNTTCGLVLPYITGRQIPLPSDLLVWASNVISSSLITIFADTRTCFK